MLNDTLENMWNKQADEFNPWSALGLEEKLEFAIKVERNRCIDIVETYQVPVGNSSAGEMAAEWTMDALREIRNSIRLEVS